MMKMKKQTTQYIKLKRLVKRIDNDLNKLITDFYSLMDRVYILEKNSEELKKELKK